MPIMHALDKLHKKGYVHSDVRLQNMVFPRDGEAKLIDFDLTDNVGVPYPPNYNKSLEECHPSPKRNYP